jgi:hypothetical protein
MVVGDGHRGSPWWMMKVECIDQRIVDEHMYERTVKKVYEVSTFPLQYPRSNQPANSRKTHL